MLKLGVRCVRYAVSGADLTDFGKAVCVSLLLVLSCALSPAFAQVSEVPCPAGSQAMTGSGTASTPYQVTNICQLQGISSSPAAYYVLMDNIDARETEGWNNRAGFEPIASFSGSFVNPGTYEIRSLTISRGEERNVGLFSVLGGGTIQGIRLVGSRTTGRENVGSLVGFNTGAGVIEGCFATDSVVGGGNLVGGLVGQSNGNINNSNATGSVSGNVEVGGLVGYQDLGSVTSGSNATVSVSGNDHVGGLVGRQAIASTISDSYATGSVFGTGDNIGGLVGESGGNIINGYATGSVFGQRDVGGLVGRRISASVSTISNSYYAARGRNNGLGEERTFAQLRCPTTPSAACGSLSDLNQRTYEGWNADVWDFGSATDLPQLFGTQGSDSPLGVGIQGSALNRKPYIKGSAELVVETGFAGVTQFSLEADYQGTPSFGESVILTWSVSGVPDQLSDLVYFVREDGTTGKEVNGSVAMLSVVRDGLAAGSDFYVVLTNNISTRDDRILVRVENARRPYILRNDTVSARIGSTTTFGFSVGYAGPPGEPVTLTWSVSDVPDTLRDFVYFALEDGVTSATFTDRGESAAGFSPVTLVVVGNVGLAGKSFYVELRNNISDNADRVLIRTEADQPYIFRDGDIRPATTMGNTTFSFSVGYTGSTDPVTLTWSLSDVPPSLSNSVYFVRKDGSTDEMFTDSGKLTSSASPVMLVVAGNEGSAGEGFYVELKNDISANVDRIPVRVAGASPVVDGGREQTETIWDGSDRTILRFSATDQDSPGSRGAGLSWDFFSRDGVAEGSTVVFTGSQSGGVVEVEVRRDSLDLYVGSFVLAVESPAGVKTTFTVTIEDVCSAVPGEDLMAGQAGEGTSDNPYQIRRLCQLQDISSSPTAYYELVDNIDASRTEDWNEGAGFEPIASSEDGFSGSFVNTNNYVISSLTISRGDTDNVGLFSKSAVGATIRGIVLVGSRTIGGNYVGSLVGFGAGVIKDCSVTGSVSGVNQVGGLVGAEEFTSSISGSSAAGSVSGESEVGGLVGHQVFSARISDSYATGSVFGQSNVGGLVGYQEPNASVISDSYATGSVVGVNENIGGLVGHQEANSNIRGSYATGSVSGQSNVGGLVGRSQGNINNGYATGSVSGQSNIGGLVGYQELDASVISYSYATGSVFGTDESVGGLVGNQGDGSSISNSYYPARGQSNGLGEERTFAQLRCPMAASATCPSGSQENTYGDWDANVWDFGSVTDLPQLSSNRNSELNLKPYIKGSVDLVVVTDFTVTTQLSLVADYLGPPGESVILTWSLSGVPTTLRHLVYFDLGVNTTSTTFTDSVKPTDSAGTATLVVVSNEDLAGRSFYVVLKNDISANDDRIPVRVAGASPLVDGGGDQIGMIQESLLSDILSFSATDPDNPYSDGAGLSWSFLSTDIAEGSTVRFSGTTRGGTVEVEVVRPSLDFYDVGSFVLEVKSPVGVDTTFTVTIETVCSTVPGEDLMAGQSGEGTSDNPYQIRRICQLQDVSSNLSAYYELAADIDASRTRDWNDGAGFDPIASGDGDGFSGSFVSTNNYVISSLTISRGDTFNVGLFSKLAAGATIRGIVLVGSRTIGLVDVGSLVGSNQGVIEDSSVTGSVFGYERVGGLVGYNNGEISGSSVSSTVTGTLAAGGLVGLNAGSINNSYATGSVFGTGDGIGGLVGFQGINSSIRDSYATGSVSGREQVGGLVGGSQGDINNSYATGSVSGDNFVGGLAGGSQGDINNSYATGSVFGTGESVGGLVGEQGISSSIVNSYYYPARGRNNGLGEERTFAQLRCPMAASATCSLSSLDQRTYGDWDANVWDFGTATELPQLLSNRNSDLNLKPYIKSSPELVVVAGFPGIMQLSLEADYPGPPGESVALTWSLLFDESSTLGGLVYFELGDSTTSTEANGSVATLVAVRDDLMTGKGFYVVLKNNISANDDRIRVRIVGESPLVDGEREQIGTIQDGLLSNILSFSATDPDNPYSDGAGLSWSFLSTDIAEDLTVRFSGSTGGGTVEVEVVRPSLDFYGVGSFVLEVKSTVGVDTTFTVTIETVCSTVPGEDLVAGQSGEGTSDNPYQIRRICQLQDVSSSPTAYYELAADIDASRTRDWNDGAGFEPIASTPTDGFSGSFVSTNNYVISSLTISRSDMDRVGLFSILAAGATIRGIVLVGSRTTGRNIVGSLVGSNNQGVIEDSAATGFVSGSEDVGGLVGYSGGSISGSYTASTVTGTSTVGGLAGQQGILAMIRDCTATGSVSGGSQIGGLVGQIGGNINNSYVASKVTGTDNVGGLVGRQSRQSRISNSSATGSVSGRAQVGGLVGWSYGETSGSFTASTVTGTGNNVGGLVGLQDNRSSISSSYATGSVSGREQVGGLVGWNNGEISGSFTASTVTGTGYVGGLVGVQYIRSSISNSYATGSVSGDNFVGGLAGGSQGDINNSYATGSVFGTGESVGGLVGEQGSNSSISNSYATGSVFGTGESVGGLVGYQASSSIVNSYYAARGRNNGLGEGRTFAQLRCPTTVRRFCLLGSQENTYGDWDANVWDFGSATDLPQLSSNRNLELNLKPYVKGSADLVVVTASTGVTQLFLEADYLGPPGESVTLTWSLSGVPTSLRDLVYFDLGGGSTSTMFTDPGKPTSGASTATLVVVGSGLTELVGKGFYVVLRNNISGDVDRIPIQVLQEAPTALTRPLRVKVYLGGAVR